MNPLDHLMTSQPRQNAEVSEAVRLSRLPVYTYQEQDLTDALKTEQGTMRLRPVQNKALIKARDAGGLLGIIGCGHGKTLITLLIGRVLQFERVVLLLPAALIEKTRAEALEYQEHFSFSMPALISYERLSRESGMNALDQYNPQLIVCDEAHKLKSLASTRTRRLGRYLYDHPDCKFAVMSGTLYNKTVADFAHLADWVLEEQSPVPRNARDTAALDNLLTGEADRFEYAAFNTWLNRRKPREALYQTLAQSAGVVITEQEQVKSSLRLEMIEMTIPDDLRSAINTCFADGVVDGLEDYIDADILSLSDHLWEDSDAFALRALAQVTMGCLYVWNWQGERDDQWLQARRDWARAVRRLLEAQEELDSPALIFNRFDELDEGLKSIFQDAYTQWAQVRHRKQPNTEQHWISDYFIEAVCKLAHRTAEPVIIWCDLQAVGERIAKKLNISYFGAGATLPAKPVTCVMSVKAHGTGKNLQAWSRNIIAHPIADPSTYEQLIARTHRTGQAADEVTVTAFHFSIFGSALRRAIKQAHVVQDSTQQPMRLCYADKIRVKYEALT